MTRYSQCFKLKPRHSKPRPPPPRSRPWAPASPQTRRRIPRYAGADRGGVERGHHQRRWLSSRRLYPAADASLAPSSSLLSRLRSSDIVAVIRRLLLRAALFGAFCRSLAVLHCRAALAGGLWRSNRSEHPHVFERRGLIGKDSRLVNLHVLEWRGPIGKDLSRAASFWPRMSDREGLMQIDARVA